MIADSGRFIAAGSIHRVPLPTPVAGALYATGFSVAGPDPAGALAEVEAHTMVCLLTPDEIDRRYPEYAAWLVAASPHEALHVAVDDQGVADDEAMLELVGAVIEQVQDGRGVLTHCGAGLGRAGMVCILTLVGLGHDLESAMATVRRARPGAGPQSAEQDHQLGRLALHASLRPAR
ncbi:MAG: hypothetical protein GY929_04405 [Actinomycetia bacterium]|nr:hypothetical protein [Actinomycetes bacterium]